MTGPVEEGSIVAHIKGEMAQFDEAMDRAQARAEKLSTTKAELKVDADVDQAIAKVTAAEAAMKKLGDGDIQASQKTISARNAAARAMAQYEAEINRVAGATARATFADEKLRFADDAEWRIRQRTTSSAEEKRAALLSMQRATKEAALANIALTDSEQKQAFALQRVIAAYDAWNASLNADANPKGPKTPPGSRGSGAAAALPGPTAAAPLVATGIAALVASLAPLAGYVAGVTGAFTMMGAAGVLAVFGIKNAMADGTAAGNTYSAGLQVLKGDFDALSKTAADVMLSRFQTALATVDGSMPALNADIRVFAGLLGDTGNVLLKTVISGLQIIMPLFVQAGVYVEQLAVTWKKWTTGGGLAAFVRTAVTGLPQVANALGSLLSGALAVISGLAPLGTILLSIVWAVGELLQGLGFLMNNGFTPLVIAAAGAVGAFKLWGVIAPIVANVAASVYKATGSVVALGIALDATSGPVGVAVAAWAAVGAALAIVKTQQDNATQAVLDYTAAVQQDNGVAGESVRLQAAKNLVQADSYQTAQKLGISQKELTDAVLNGGGAYKDLSGKIKDASSAADRAAASAGVSSTGQLNAASSATTWAKKLHDLLSALTDNHDGIKNHIKVYNEVQKQVDGVTISTGAQLAAVTALAGKYGESLQVWETAKVAQKTASDQLIQTTANTVAAISAAGFLGQENSDAATSFSKIAIAAANATNAASQWKSELDVLNGGTQSLEQANINLAGDYQTMATQITSNIKSMGRAAATTLDINTAGGLANHQLILKSIQDAEAQSAAIIAAEGDTAKAREDGRQSLITARQAILDHAKAAGLDVDQVQALIDKELKIPAHVSTQIEINISQAEAAIAKVQDKIAHIRDVKGVITYNTSTQALVGNAAGGTIGFANGGSIPGFAGGGGPYGTVFGPGSSTSDSVLARLSVGEEVTRASAANVPGVRSLLKMINRDPSGTMSALASQPKPQKTIVNHWHILQAIDPSSLYSEVQRRQNLVAQ